jgi:hypothetical protein
MNEEVFNLSVRKFLKSFGRQGRALVVSESSKPRRNTYMPPIAVSW